MFWRQHSRFWKCKASVCRFPNFWASTLGFLNSGRQLWCFLQNFSDFFRGVNFSRFSYKSFLPKLDVNWPTQRQLLQPSVSSYFTDYDSNMKIGEYEGISQRSFLFFCARNPASRSMWTWTRTRLEKRAARLSAR